jgi:hypothetical protein
LPDHRRPCPFTACRASRANRVAAFPQVASRPSFQAQAVLAFSLILPWCKLRCSRLAPVVNRLRLVVPVSISTCSSHQIVRT